MIGKLSLRWAGEDKEKYRKANEEKLRELQEAHERKLAEALRAIEVAEPPRVEKADEVLKRYAEEREREGDVENEAHKPKRMRDLPYGERIKLYERAMALRKEKGWSAYRIAKELNVLEMTIYNWLHENKKPAKFRYWQKEEDEALRRMAKEGMTLKEMSERLGRSKHSVACRKMELGLTKYEPIKLDEGAIGYLAGLINGEGCFSLSGKRWPMPAFVISMTDKDALEKVAKWLKTKVVRERKTSSRPRKKQAWKVAVVGQKAMDVFNLTKDHLTMAKREQFERVMRKARERGYMSRKERREAIEAKIAECLKKHPNASVAEIAKEVGISRETAYRYLKRLKLS
jgi:DNA-binding CsgD family transcriptional regulator